MTRLLMCAWLGAALVVPVGGAARAQRSGGPGGTGPNATEARGIQVTLPRGTRLLVRLTTPMSTASQRAGAHFRARLLNDLRSDGAVLAPAGAQIVGEVTRSSGGHDGGVQRLQATLVQISYRGDLVDIVTDTVKVESVGDAPARNAGSATLLGVQLDRDAAGVVALLDDDRHLTVPSGSRVELRLLRPLTVWR